MTEQAQPTNYSPAEVEAMLALVTTVEPTIETTSSGHQRPTTVLRTDFSGFTPQEIVSVIGAVYEANAHVSQEHSWNLGHPVAPIEVTDVDRRLAEYNVNDGLLNEMPKIIGIDKARGVFTLLAYSNIPVHRYAAAAYIGALVEADHDYGVELWKHLLTHDDPHTGASAWGSLQGLERFYYDDPSDLMGSLETDGLTLADFLGLIATYVEHLRKVQTGDGPS